MKSEKLKNNIGKAPSFQEFWAAYPLHRARIPAERVWKRLTAEQKNKALAALSAYKEECQRTGIAYKYAQGWLNDHRWEDYSAQEAPIAEHIPDVPDEIPNACKKW